MNASKGLFQQVPGSFHGDPEPSPDEIAREATEIARDLTGSLLTIFNAQLRVLKSVDWEGIAATFDRIRAALDEHEHRPRMKDRAARRRAGYTRTGRRR